MQTLKLQIRISRVQNLNRINHCDYPSVEIYQEVQINVALRTKNVILKSPMAHGLCYFGEWFRDDYVPQVKKMKTYWTSAGAIGKNKRTLFGGC